MAVQKINYENKEAIQNDTDIANKNKVTDADMNEIKTVVNNNANELQELQNKEVNNSTDIEQLKRNTLELQTNVNNIQQEQATQNQKILNNSNNLDLVADQLGETEQGFLQYKLENNQRVTDAEQNIIDLQGRERLNKEKIETLQQEVQELEQDIKANALEEETEQAKSLYITDASGARGKLKVLGNDEQETRSGKNKFDLQKYFNYASITNCNSKTLIKNGIELSFTAGADAFIGSALAIDDVLNSVHRKACIKVKPNTTYTLQMSSAPKCYLSQLDSTYKAVVHYKALTETYEKLVYTFTTGDNVEYIYLRFGIKDSNYTKYSFTDIQLEEGSTATDYEMYGASPSLDYPSPIKCLGSNTNLVTEVLNNLWYNADTNKFITMQNTVSVIAEIPQNANITINKKNGGNRFAVMTSNTKPQLDVDLTTVFIDNENPNRKTYTFKNRDKKWIWVGVQNGGTEEDKQKAIEEMKIEQGETATSYSPFGQGSTEIKKYNKNLAEDIEIYSTKGQFGTMCIAGYTIKKGEKYIISFDTPNSGTDCYLQNKDDIKLDCGDYYYTNLDGTRKSIVVTALATGYIRSTKGIILKRTNDNKETGLISNFMIEKWNGSNTASSYKETEKDVFLLDIQQEMLTGDYFDLDRKKEIHTWSKVVLNGTENIQETTGTTKYFVIANAITGPANDIWNNSSKQLATHFVVGLAGYANKNCFSFNYTGALNIEIKEEMSVEEFKTLLAEQYAKGTPLTFWCKLATPIELDLTVDQIEVLEKLSKLRFYNGVNNILTTEDIALLQAIYPVSIQTKINNVISTQLNQIGGN